MHKNSNIEFKFNLVSRDLKDVLKNGIDILKTVNNQSYIVEARILLCYVLKCDKTFLFSHDDYKLTEDEIKKFEEVIRLRANGIPLQYITGRQEFMSLDFIVNPNVLIPRQETETLVETIINYVNDKRVNIKKNNKRKINSKSRLNNCSYDSSNDCSNNNYNYDNDNYDNIRILEIGTGSGCVAVSLASYIDNCFITAVDVSRDAINVAKRNAILNCIDKKIDFVLSDLFENVGSDESTENSKFDIIVSNPPYIGKKEIEQLQIEVKDHEPILALDGGIDGLDFYRLIVEKAPAYLKDNGLIALEIGYDQGQKVSQLMDKKFVNIKIIKDLEKNDRVVTGNLK